jgi:hypothetical protein
MILNKLITPAKKLYAQLGLLKLKTDYSLATIKNRYPCKIVGEQHLLENHDTEILYTIFSKRDVYKISVKDLLNDPDLLAQFHPTQTLKIGFIAFGDILLNMPEEQRTEKYKQIVGQMMDNKR